MLTDDNRAAPGLDAWVVPDLALKLGFDATSLQQALEANYPSVREHDKIQWGKPQWIWRKCLLRDRCKWTENLSERNFRWPIERERF